MVSLTWADGVGSMIQTDDRCGQDAGVCVCMCACVLIYLEHGGGSMIRTDGVSVCPCVRV